MLIGVNPVRSVSQEAIRPSSKRGAAAAGGSSRAVAVVKVPLYSSGYQRPHHRHADSGLIAQLFAARDNHPQTRDKRRAEPVEAIRHYQIAAGLTAKVQTPHIDVTT